MVTIDHCVSVSFRLSVFKDKIQIYYYQARSMGQIVTTSTSRVMSNYQPVIGHRLMGIKQSLMGR